MQKLFPYLSSSFALWVIHITVCGGYLLKAIAKLAGGIVLSSPVLINDGLHGIIDIVEHGIITVVSKIARDGNLSKYPLGKMPLLDIIGLVIGLSVICLGFKCLAEALGLTALALNHLWNISNIIPVWLWDVLVNDKSYRQLSPLPIALIMLGCWTVSIVTHRIEISLAVLHDWKEYKVDANELFQNSLLELITGLGMLIVAGVLYISPPKPSTFSISMLISESVTPVMLVFLGFYFIRNGMVMIYEECHELLNPPLDRKHVLNLITTVNENLPDGCSVIEEDRVVKIWRRSSKVYVIGTIEIANNCWEMASNIIEDCKHTISNFISGIDGGYETIVHLQPHKLVCEVNIETEWKAWIKKIAGDKAHQDILLCFTLLRKSNFCSLENCIRKLEQANLSSIERGLLLWFKGQVDLEVHGAMSEEVSKVSRQVRKYCEQERNPVAMLLMAWDVLRCILLPSEQRVNSEISFLEDINSVIEDNNFPVEIRAECSFIMGMYWERAANYDLARSVQFYRRALSLYFSGVAPSEADRLLNTWGHQKTLMLELSEAKRLIKRSLQIKRRKADVIGLAYSIGCLADNYTREGLYQEALLNYDYNLKYLKEAETFYLPFVQIKRTECLFRIGILSSNIALIEETEKAAAELQKQLPFESDEYFFASKCLSKCIFVGSLLKYSHLNSSRFESQRFGDVLPVIDSKSKYIQALLKRMEGRYQLLLNNINSAIANFEEAAKLFESMARGTSHRTTSLESLLCKFEIGIIKVIYKNGDKQIISDNIALIRDLFSSLGGLTGNAGILISKYMDEIELYIKKYNKDIKFALTCYRPIFFLNRKSSRKYSCKILDLCLSKKLLQ